MKKLGYYLFAASVTASVLLSSADVANCQSSVKTEKIKSDLTDLKKEINDLKHSLRLIKLEAGDSVEMQYVRQKISPVMEKYKAVGLAVAVVKNGRIVFSDSYGYKNLETGEKLKGGELFRIASISKSFTATAIMQLVDKEMISLNEEVGDILGFKLRNPAFPDIPITVSMLLSHTSSLNDTQGYFNFDVVDPKASQDYVKCFNNYSPGSKYEYCNLGYNMLGAIVEKITGVRFDLYVLENILSPLGIYGGFNVDMLDRTKFAQIHEYNSQDNSFKVQPAAYKSRAEELKNYRIGYTTPIFSATGGMKISATDLAKYMSMHMNYGKLGSIQIISEESSQLMQSEIINAGNNIFYGFALEHAYNLIPEENMVGHTGSAYGLYSAMFFEPEKKFGFVIISNGAADGYVEGFANIQRETIRVLYDYFIRYNE